MSDLPPHSGLSRGAGHMLRALTMRVLTPVVTRALLTWEFCEAGVAYNPTSAQVRKNPYPIYDRLRRKDPAHRMRLGGAWVLSRYEDCNVVLRDHKRFRSYDPDYGGASHRVQVMLDLDPPDHTRLRALVSLAFTPRTIARLTPRIRCIADELLDALAETPRFDLMADFAYPLPITVIAELIGVPPSDMDVFKGWSRDLALSIEPLINDEQLRRVERSNKELYAYFERMIERRRHDPGDDFITSLLAAEEEGDRLTRDELIGTLMLLLVAGHETTQNLIGNGLLALLRHPDQLQRLRDHPDQIELAVNELLRYDSPVQFVRRYVAEEVEIGGKRILAGQSLLCLVGAANHDPSVFTDPHLLDIGRREQSHLSFGRGVHYCLGSALATLEARIAFTALLRHFSAIRLAAEPRYRKQIVLRGPEELWLAVERAPQPALAPR